MSQRDTIIHLVAGGIAGTNGAVLTCPLEVVKTRLQSSNPVFGQNIKSSSPIGSTRNIGSDSNGYRGSSGTSASKGKGYRNFSTCASCGRSAQMLAVSPHHGNPFPQPTTPKIGLIQCLRLIIEKEGPRALFKGLGPNLIGVAPSRAIYFSAYSTAKNHYNEMLPPDSPIVHICSAATAGFVASTATNPVWFIKTRLQLEGNTYRTGELIRKIYAQNGILGFYKGISASYMGISETVIHFVIYEAVKKKLQEWNATSNALDDNEVPNDNKTTKDFLQFMVAGAFSKTVASCVAYPHEVARTRLREEGNKYRSLLQTLCLVAKEEGYRGLYRGLTTQLIRQIPNTAIMMSTYEAAVYILNKSFPPVESTFESTPISSQLEYFDESFETNDAQTSTRS